VNQPVSTQKISSFDPEFLYENSPCGHLSFYPDLPIVKINKTLLSWLGLHYEDVVGQKKFQELLNVGGKLYFQMVVLPLINHKGSVNEINFEVDIKNGEKFSCLFNATSLKEDNGEQMVIHATILKITDRKKYESELLRSKQIAEEERKKFELLSNIIPEIIWTALANGSVNFLNERFFEYFNHRDILPRKTSILHLIHNKDFKRLAKLWLASIEQGTAFEAEVMLKKSTNKYEWFLVRAVPYRDASHQVSMWFGSCTNIDEHKREQLETVKSLNKASEVISEKDKRLEDIAYIQAHLVRRPLANIIGLVDILGSLDDDLTTQNYVLSMLKQSTTELDNMVKEVMLKS
jgi:PAS domain S-box-containing protein